MPCGPRTRPSSSESSSTALRVAQYTDAALVLVGERVITDQVALALSPISSTLKERFARSKPVTTDCGEWSPSISEMSSRTRFVAVAVKAATTGALGQRVDEVGDREIGGPEILAPLGYAVRLIDRDQGQAQSTG